MNDENIKQVIQDAYEKGVLSHSNDAQIGRQHGYYVSVDKVEEFVKFIANHPLVVRNAAKPYVGMVLGLQRHKKMRVHRLNMGYYPSVADSNVLFPRACLILDENDTHLCVLGNDNIKYWIKRFYFTGPVLEDGTILPKKMTITI